MLEDSCSLGQPGHCLETHDGVMLCGVMQRTGTAVYLKLLYSYRAELGRWLCGNSLKLSLHAGGRGSRGSEGAREGGGESFIYVSIFSFIFILVHSQIILFVCLFVYYFTYLFIFSLICQPIYPLFGYSSFFFFCLFFLFSFPR